MAVVDKMSLFKLRPMCVFCERKKPMRLSVKDIGVCERCFEEIAFTSEHTSFQPFGKNAEFSYLISDFYYEGRVRDAILEYKFKGAHAYARVFFELIKDRIDVEHLKKFDMIVPVPLSKERMIERGYNQSALIAEPIAEHAGIEYNDTALIRVKNTQKQSLLEKRMRAENVKDAFRADGVRGKRVVVFDDIYTTGFTMNECALTLKNAGAKEVIGYTLSITPHALLATEDYIENPF